MGIFSYELRGACLKFILKNTFLNVLPVSKLIFDCWKHCFENIFSSVENIFKT